MYVCAPVEALLPPNALRVELVGDNERILNRLDGRSSMELRIDRLIVGPSVGLRARL